MLVALYVLSFPYHPGLRSPNELCRLWQSRALVDFGTWNLNGVLARQGLVGDLSCVAVVQESGRDVFRPCVGPDAPRGPVTARWYYPSKAPLLSVLAAPVYALLKLAQGEVSELSQVLWSRLCLTIVPTLFLLVLLRRFLAAHVPQSTADMFTFVYGLGTMAFNYAEAFMSHQLTAVLLFGAWYMAWRIEHGGRPVSDYGWVGLVSALAVAAEYTAALGVLCLASYTVAKRWRQGGLHTLTAAGWVVLGAAPVFALLLWYHQLAFGSPWASGYKFLNDAGYMGWHQGGFLGIRAPDWAALGLSFFSPLRGLFVLTPLFLAVPWGVRLAFKRDAALGVLSLVLLLAHTYFTASFSYASWGWTVGPRHLTGTLPFLILPAALVFERAGKQSLIRSWVAGLAVASVLTTQLVAFVNYIPDTVASSVWGLALPLLAKGTFPVSWLAAWWPNPASGGVLIVLAAVACAWLVLRFRAQGAGVWVMLLAVALHFATLWIAPRLSGDTQAAEKDAGAQQFLQSVWVAPPGAVLHFSSP